MQHDEDAMHAEWDKYLQDTATRERRPKHPKGALGYDEREWLAWEEAFKAGEVQSAATTARLVEEVREANAAASRDRLILLTPQQEHAWRALREWLAP